MSSVKVNREILAAYLEGELSPDAERSLRLELARDPGLRRLLEQERRLLETLDALARVPPPAEFVAGVMGRVAQQPSHRPRRAVAWVAVARWVTAAALLLGAVGLGAAGWVFAAGGAQGGVLGGWLARALAGGIDAATDLLHLLQAWVDPARALVEEASKLAWRLLTAGSAAGWLLQVTLLLFTVSLQ